MIHEYPEAVGVMLFYRIGEYFEHRAVERSRSQIMGAVDMRPETVNRIQGENIVEILQRKQKKEIYFLCARETAFLLTV